MPEVQPRVVVKLHDDITIPYEDGAERTKDQARRSPPLRPRPDA